MGNRAVITMEDGNGVQHPVALYVHWNGGLESVLAFMEFTCERFDRGRDDLYTFHARLCQVIGNFFSDGLSLYAYPLEDAEKGAEWCDNGRFHWRVNETGVTLIGRETETDAAREHAYWTGNHPIKGELAARMPKEVAT